MLKGGLLKVFFSKGLNEVDFLVINIRLTHEGFR